MSSKSPSLRRLLLQVHKDEAGAISLEAVLLVAVIALPILVFLVKWGWPAIKEYFIKGAHDSGIDIESQ